MSDSNLPFDLLLTAGRVFCADTQLDDADVDLCVEAATSAGKEIGGIAFNTMRNPAITHDPRQIMRRGMDAPTADRFPPASTWSRSTSRATPPNAEAEKERMACSMRRCRRVWTTISRVPRA